MVLDEKSGGIISVIRIHALGTMSVFIQFKSDSETDSRKAVH